MSIQPLASQIDLSHSALLGTIASLRAQASQGDPAAIETLASVAAQVRDFMPASMAVDQVTLEFRDQDGTVQSQAATEVVYDLDPADAFGHPALAPETPPSVEPSTFFDGDQAGFTFEDPTPVEPVAVRAFSVVARPEAPSVRRPDLDTDLDTSLLAPAPAPRPTLVPALTPPTAPTPGATAPTPYRTPGSGSPLSAVRDWLFERIDEGADCPACDRFARIHPRPVNAGMVRMLATMWRKAGLEWFYMPDVRDWNGRDEAMLRYWDLIEEATNLTRPDGGHAGWWRVTAQGRDYLYGRLTIDKYAHVYNGEVRYYSGPQVSVSDAVKRKFDLAALLSTPTN